LREDRSERDEARDVDALEPIGEAALHEADVDGRLAIGELLEVVEAALRLHELDLHAVALDDLLVLLALAPVGATVGTCHEADEAGRRGVHELHGRDDGHADHDRDRNDDGQQVTPRDGPEAGARTAGGGHAARL
jgi:hypothetical protein